RLPGQAFGGARHAADRAQYPDLVANADSAIRPAIAHEGSGHGRLHLYRLRLVDIVLGARQGGDHVVGVDVVARGDRLRRLADNEAVLVHLFAFGDGAHGDLVALRYIARHFQAHTARFDFAAGGNIPQRHTDIVGVVHINH